MIAQSADRNAFLLQKASEFSHSKSKIWEITDSEIRKLESFRTEPLNPPASIDLLLQVSADSRSELDSGRYKIVVSPGVGTLGAGRTMGRFAYMLGAPALSALKMIYEKEKLAAGDGIVADVRCWPIRKRAVNVSLSPSTSDFKISVGCIPNQSESEIAISDILITLDRGKFSAIWSKTGQRLIIRSCNFLNPVLLPDAVRFLLDLSCHNVTPLIPFDWAEAANLVVLPRVQYGNKILSPAYWNIDARLADSVNFENAFTQLRTTYQIPDSVFLSTGASDDNQLYLNLLDPADMHLLKRAVKEARRRAEPVVLVEYISNCKWHNTKTGQYSTEFAVSLIRASQGGVSSAFLPTIADSQASFPPGTEWAYLRIDCPNIIQEELVADFMQMLKPLLRKKVVDRWFFVRYSDSIDHLRLRVHGISSRMFSEILPKLSDWAQRHVSSELATSYSLQTYVPEIERYGGPKGMQIAEEIFCAESNCIAAIFKRSKVIDRISVSVLLMNILLESFSRSETDTRMLLRNSRSQTDIHMSSKLWHSLKHELLQFLSGELIPTDIERYSILELAHELKVCLVSAANRLYSLQAAGALTTPVEELIQCFVHMQCIRVLGVGITNEALSRALLYRAAMSFKYRSQSSG